MYQFFQITFLISLIVPFLYVLQLYSTWNLTNSYLWIGLSIQFLIGLSIYIYSFTENKTKSYLIPLGYTLFFLGLSGSYFSDKSILLPIFWELSTFGSILVYLGLPFKEKRSKSLVSLFIGSGISAVFITGWVFLPDENPYGKGFLLLAFLIKSGFSIVHAWYPDLHEGAPTSISASFSGISLNLPLLLFFKYFPSNSIHPIVYKAIIPIAGIGVFLGGVSAFFSKNVKRSLAYSSIEKSNFLWLSLFLYKFWSENSEFETNNLSHLFLILFYLTLIQHSFSKSFQFLIFGFLGDSFSTNNIDKLKGTGRYLGLPVLLGGLGTFSFASLPGTLGFVSESTYFYILTKLVDLPSGTSAVILPAMIILIIGLVLGLGAHLKMYLSIFLSIPDPKITNSVNKEIPKSFLNTIQYMSILLISLPISINAFLFFQKDYYLTNDYQSWLFWILMINFGTILYFFILINFKLHHKITFRKGWDCGNQYNGNELSIPSSVISDPLGKSLGITIDFTQKESGLDLFIKEKIVQFLDLGKYWIKQVESGDTSNYLAFSASMLMISLLFIFIIRLINEGLWQY
jgi:formate hydrogenlyase subunit 3/multisubunit Na+/H+ antiporter MnhD subunit